jgi:superfamily II DNA or RNA helicase
MIATGIRLRAYQQRAVDFILPLRRGFVVAPAGSGKTIIAACAASMAYRPFEKIVWLANTREQVQQARDAIRLFDWPEPVEIEVQCVASLPDLSDAEIVILDEAHHLPAATWSATAIRAQGTVWGFSATPFCGDWERDNSLRAFFENQFFTVPRQEVLAGGSITRGEVVIHDLDQPACFDSAIRVEADLLVEERKRRFRVVPTFELQRRALWEVTARYVRENSDRNSRIVELARSGSGVLVLVGSIEHGEKLQAQIPGSQLVHSKIAAGKRKGLIQAAREGALRCMIATSLADEGLDVPRLETVVLAAGGRSAGKLEQRTGRVMRPSAGKLRGLVHDFADRGAALAHSQFKARLRTYRKLGYSITQ